MKYNNKHEQGIVCKICNAVYFNGRKFVKHLTDKHSTKTRMYYDTFLKKETEGSCKTCNKAAVYKSLFKGYSETCCNHSCIAINNRRKLKDNPEKYNKFVNKVKSNVTRLHATMDPAEKQRRINKAAIKAKANNSLLTDKERKQKFGWLNKLTLEEKEKFIRDVLLQTGSHAWWKRASKEEKLAKSQKRSDTAKRNRLDNFELYEQFRIYRGTVDFLTQKTYKKYRKEINPNLLPRRSGTKGYHLDHKYSAYQGFLDGLSVEVIASKHNLHMLPGSINLSKSDKCCITKEDLVRLYEQEKNSKV